MTSPIDPVRAERDLYLRLLHLGGQDSLEPFLREALAVVVDLAHARKGYLEVGDPDATADGGAERWSMAHGCDANEVDAFRHTLSKSIIAAALARGETVLTAQASVDPRFRDQSSVIGHGIEAVLCTPIGGVVPIGVIYLQGRDLAGGFTADDVGRTELFARHVAPYADRLLARERTGGSLDPTARWRARLTLPAVIGRSAALADVLRHVAIAAPAAAPVLLTGPSGTGKGLLARVIHDNSPRRSGPFVELNCGAIPEGLMESELFGALPGSYTGAVRRILGKVEAARGGTLFLDEVAELRTSLQVKLLTLLQSGGFYPVGSDRAMQADIRVIAASNRDLDEAVAAGAFRLDLFHRLHVVSIAVPPLAQRSEDIVPLARHFAAVSAARNGIEARPLTVEAGRALRRAPWPGNVRELANKIEWAVLQVAAEHADAIDVIHLFDRDAEVRGPRTWQAATRAFQRALLLETLEEAGWNRSEAARRLGISRQYLYEALDTLGIRQRE